MIRRASLFLVAVRAAHIHSTSSRLMLTSSGLTTSELEKSFGSLFREASKATGEAKPWIAMVVTAQMAPSNSGSKRSPGELRRRRWADARKKGRQLQQQIAGDVGAQVKCIDCAHDTTATISEAISQAQCIWVTGGNTFFLWHHMRRSGTDAMIRQRLKDGALYVGCSAGSIVAGLSLETAHWKGWDDDTVVDVDWTDESNRRTMGLTQHVIFPHYEPQWADLVEERRGACAHALLCLDESSAFISAPDVREVGEAAEAASVGAD